MNYVEKWNKLDSIIYFFESKIGAIRNAACNDEESEPDVELMIRAETEHLRNENENLNSCSSDRRGWNVLLSEMPEPAF